MKKFLGLMMIMFPLSFPVKVSAAEMGIDATTFFRFEQRSIPGFSEKTLVPATQFLTVNLGKTADGNLSFHLSGWGRADLADRSTNSGSTDGDLSYGYLMYTFPRANGQVKAGRIYVYDAGTVEQLDGVTGRVDLFRGVTLSAFGGKPVGQDDIKDNRGNFIGGGRLGYRYNGKVDMGISYLHEDDAWSREYLSASELRTIWKFRQRLSGDLWVSPIPVIEFTGRTSYDPVVGELSDQSYQATIRPHRSWTVTAEYNEQELQSVFATANYPLTMFRPMKGTRISSYGGTAAFAVSKPLELSADYRHTEYRRSGYGNSQKYGIGARLLLRESFRLGASYHRLDGQGDLNSYNEYRAWGMYTYRSFFSSLDLIAHKFEKPIYREDTAFDAILSAGYRLTPQLAVAGNVSYGWNPQKDSDTRAMFKLDYNYETKGAR